MRVCLMIEGQEDVTWDDWVALARACEDHGLEGLFRSDHYESVVGIDGRGSLDAWTTLAGLAAVTERIRLGTLVSPVTFRHPALLARAVVTVDHISAGRVELGLGAGWHRREHAANGFPFPDTGTRMDLLAEQLEVIVRQWTEDHVDIHGEHYRVEASRALPKPLQQPRPRLIVGGLANRRSASLAARWADEYNTIVADPATCRERRDRVERAFEESGRDPGELTFSLMTGCLVGSDRAELEERARRLMSWNRDTGDVGAWLDGRREQWVIGTVDEVVERLDELAGAGVDRVMLQHLLHRDLDTVRLLGDEVAPAVAASGVGRRSRPGGAGGER